MNIYIHCYDNPDNPIYIHSYDNRDNPIGAMACYDASRVISESDQLSREYPSESLTHTLIQVHTLHTHTSRAIRVIISGLLVLLYIGLSGRYSPILSKLYIES